MDKINSIKYKGKLNLSGDFSIDCYVLTDARRVLSARGVQRALGMVDEKDNEPSGSRLQRHLNQKSLHPFLYAGRKKAHFDPIICYIGKKNKWI